MKSLFYHQYNIKIVKLSQRIGTSAISVFLGGVFVIITFLLLKSFVREVGYGSINEHDVCFTGRPTMWNVRRRQLTPVIIVKGVRWPRKLNSRRISMCVYFLPANNELHEFVIWKNLWLLAKTFSLKLLQTACVFNVGSKYTKTYTNLRFSQLQQAFDRWSLSSTYFRLRFLIWFLGYKCSRFVTLYILK